LANCLNVIMIRCLQARAISIRPKLPPNFPLQCQDGNDVDVELEFDNFFDGDFCHRLCLADQLDQLVEFFL